MEQKDFINLLQRIDETYPSQKPYNTTQKAIFWASLKDYDYQDIVISFIEHCKTDVWKPQVPAHLLKYLNNSNINLREKFKRFFDRKPQNDPIADQVLRIMGVENLRKSKESEFENKLSLFIDLYNSQKTKESYKALPNKFKIKLLGNKK
jgi:hypothetical protein